MREILRRWINKRRFLFASQFCDNENVTIKICAVGWEPNPGHASYLSELEAHYVKCGYREAVKLEKCEMNGNFHKD